MAFALNLFYLTHLVFWAREQSAEWNVSGEVEVLASQEIHFELLFAKIKQSLLAKTDANNDDDDDDDDDEFKMVAKNCLRKWRQAAALTSSAFETNDTYLHNLSLSLSGLTPSTHCLLTFSLLSFTHTSYFFLSFYFHRTTTHSHTLSQSNLPAKNFQLLSSRGKKC